MNINNWFKIYCNFAAQVDLAYLRNCIGKGLRAACKADLFWKALDPKYQ